ncbi:MAG: histidine phosphatase family protein [Gammaproteobacteria bacterium]|jgi:phosphohistidine phosphatase
MASDARQLLVLRHAKSAWDTKVANDFDRPLSKRGKQDAPRVGGWLRQQGLVPDVVVSSPAKRARKTTTKVCRELGIPKQEIWWEPRIYAATTETLLQVLSECRADAEILLLVGHNPGLEDLLGYLCGSSLSLPADGKLLPTATLARLRVAVKWKHLPPNCATLISITRPCSLPENV